MSDAGELHEIRNDLVEAKLDLVRQEMRAGFDRIETLLRKQDELEKRIHAMELSTAESKLKLQIIGLAVALGSGGAGAFLSKLF